MPVTEGDSLPQPEPFPVFYRIEPSRVTAREHLYSGWAMAPVLFLHKVFRIPITVSSDDPAVDSLRSFEVPISALDPDITSRFGPMLGKLIELGFDEPIYHHVNDRLQLVSINYATMRHVTMPIVARIHNRNWYVRHPPRSTTYAEFFTRYADGTGLWSLAERADIDRPPGFRINRIVGADPARLFAAHQREVQRDISAGKIVVPAGDREQMLALIDWQHDAVLQYHLARGVFAPLTDADHAHLAAAATRRLEAGEAGAQHADVLAQLEKLQSKRGGSWLTALIVLAVSMFLFIAAMRSSSVGSVGTPPWEYVLMVIPILLFHEAGHYVAMKVFGYRNLRMFFIPMLGAAVTGQNYTAPGWKKAIVFLMGPVPGILGAVAIGFAAIAMANPLLTKVAVMTLILNGFNLLPFLPLDGGRLMHTLIFSRWFVLDVAFRVFAAIVLLLAALRFDDRILLVVAIATIVSLPAAYKMARISSALRASGFDPGVTPDGQRIPTSTAVVIIERLKAAFKRATSTKLMAQQTLNIYESLTARPPGILGTLGFGLAYVVSFALAIAFALVFTIGQTDSRGFAQAIRNLQRRERTLPNVVRPELIERFAATSPDAPTSRENWQPRNTIIATFKDAATALRTLEMIRKDARAADASFLLFGDSVMVSFARIEQASSAHWSKRLAGYSKQVVVDSDQYKAPIRLTCSTPSRDVAQRIEREMLAYFQQAEPMQLIPPWTPDEARPPEQAAQHRHARELFVQILEADQKASADKAVIELTPLIRAASERGDRAELTKLFGRQQVLAHQARTRAREELLKAAKTESDREFIQLYPINGPDPDHAPPPTQPDEAFAAMGALMGQLPIAGGSPLAFDDRFSAMGVFDGSGQTLHVEYVLFIDPFEGLPAMVRWLRAQGCGNFRYDFGAGTNADVEVHATSQRDGG